MRFMMRAHRTWLTSLAVLACAPASAADEASARADQIKAAYVFNFVKFVEWQADAAGDIVHICFAGASGVHDSLRNATADKRAGARRIVSHPLKHGDGAGGCAILYLDSEALATSDELLQSARGTSLTISDAQHFTRAGGAIQLFMQDNRLRFVINVENARRAGVRISSNLLKLASNVEQDGAP